MRWSFAQEFVSSLPVNDRFLHLVHAPQAIKRRWDRCLRHLEHRFRELTTRNAADVGKEGGASYVDEVQEGMDPGRQSDGSIGDMSDGDHVVITIEFG